MPGPKVIFGLIENMTSSLRTLMDRMSVTGHDWSVIEQIENMTGVLSEDDLLFRTLNGGREVDVKRFFELLSGLLYVVR